MNRKIYLYIGLLLAVSWAIQIAAIIITGNINSEAARIWLALTMISPLVVTVFFLAKNRSLKQRLLWRPNKQIFVTSLFAVLIPIFIAFGVLLLLNTFGYGYSQWFSFDDTGVNISGGPFLLGKGNQAWFLFSANVFLTGAVFAMINAFIAVGEEFAWRGLLQPMLTDHYGLIKGTSVLGFVWSIWHLPALLSGYNYPEYPILGGFIFFPVRLIAISFFYVWLTQKSKSFIPAAIAHGALNGIQTGITSNIKMNSARLYEYIATIFLTIIVGLIFLVLTLKLKSNSKSKIMGVDLKAGE